MRRRCAATVAAAAIAALAALAALAAVSCTRPAALAPGASWGAAEQAPGTAALDDQSNDDGKDLVSPQLSAVSCTVAGDCTAVGKYVGNAVAGMFVISEHSGAWGKAEPLRGLFDSDALASEWPQPGLVSCSAPGDCAAAVTDSGTYALLMAGSKGGVWSAARHVPGLHAPPGPSSSWNAVSCAPVPGYCAAGGSVGGRVFVVSERGGVWGPASYMPGGDAITAISCPARGACLAGGGHLSAFLLRADRGRWVPAARVPGPVSAVACPAPGNCTVTGTFAGPSGDQQVYVLSETHGAWGSATGIPGLRALSPAGTAGVTQVSCAAAGWCAAGGWYLSSRAGRRQRAWLASETDGRWGVAHAVGQALAVREHATIAALSCGARGDCVAGAEAFSFGGPLAAGMFFEGPTEGYLVRSQSGAWGPAQAVPGLRAIAGAPQYSQVSSVSCVPGWCAVVGSYDDRNGNRRVFVLNLR